MSPRDNIGSDGELLELGSALDVAPLVAPPPAKSSRVLGWLDGVSGRIVGGWAFDPDRPSERLTVCIYADARELGRTTASLLRKDLQKSGKGDGWHGFHFSLPLELFDGGTHRLSVRVAGSDAELPGSPKTLTTQAQPPNASVDARPYSLAGFAEAGAASPADDVHPNDEPSGLGSPSRFELLSTPSQARSGRALGWLDGINGRIVDGWAFDPDRPLERLTVCIHEGVRELGRTTASLLREDLQKSGKGDGWHGFRFSLPLELFDGGTHQISVRLEGAAVELDGSPKTLTTQTLTPSLAYRSTTPTLAYSPPLSDFQFTVLNALNAVSETLLAQSRALALLVERTGGEAAARTAIPVAAITPEQHYGPLLPAALASPRAEHDYLVFAIIDWHFRIQRPQQIARQLAAKGHRVFYISVKLEAAGSCGPDFVLKSRPAEGIFEVALQCAAPVPDVYEGFEHDEQVAQLSDAIRRLADVVELRSPIAILHYPSWYPVAETLPGAILVHDCLDHLAGFSNVSPRIVALEQKLIERADTIIVTSQFLADMAEKSRSDISLVRNGADLEMFLKPPPTIHTPRKRPVIGYYGAIADWFDVGLVAHCAARHPEWHFILIGATDGCDTAPLRVLANVEFLGEKPYDELAAYLYAFDVCIIPFKLTDLIKATNPVKLYEYLCSGKPVVATPMPELTAIPEGLVRTAASPEEFDQAIAFCLAEQDENAVTKRRSWAARQSWKTRAQKFTNAVEQRFPKVSIVILCYNNLDFTRACVGSVLEFSDYPALEVICVDNASTDETATWLSRMQANHANLRCIRNDSNLGFARGNNVGLQAADGNIRILLNNDTYVTRGWITDLIRPLQRDPRVGMTGPLTNMIGNEQKIRIAYRDMEEMARASAAFTTPRRRNIFATDNLAFFCVAIRSDVIEKVGLLDEAFRLGFFEDDDYCRRVQTAGYGLAVCDGVFVHHHLSASFDQMGGTAKNKLMLESKAIFEAKWGTWKSHKYREEAGFGE